MTLNKLSLTMKALSDETRLRIIGLLGERKAMVSSLIAATLTVKTSIVSHHLRVLAREDIVTARKNGQYVLYCLNRPTTTEIMDDLNNLLGADDDTHTG